MNVTVIGAGYVGLVTGAGFAEMGNAVTCVDVDDGKIEELKRGVLPIYEPGLDRMVAENTGQGRLRFTSSLAEAASAADIFFIAVGTPPGEDGSADLRHVLAAAGELGRHIEGYAVIATKSTVPVGTAEKVRDTVSKELAARGIEPDFDVVSNPEFLKEGAAVEDFMRPTRIVIGSDSERARGIMRELYHPFVRNHERIISMSPRDAEMTKYAANSMLATRISFMNEMAGICDRLGADVENVRLGIGSDSRIGFSFIYPGCGFGGSCLPKDINALIHTAEESGLDPVLLRSVRQRNEEQKHVLFGKITARFGTDLSGRSFGVWGLAFKPGTDDMREAPSVVLLQELIGAGATVRAYDPVAMEAARRELPAAWCEDGRLVFAESQYDALAGVDALALVTEWKPFRRPDFGRMKDIMNTPVIFDGRNQYDPEKLRQEGFGYIGIGR